jgi:predicted tellurium resistance membrane protein TerC
VLSLRERATSLWDHEKYLYIVVSVNMYVFDVGCFIFALDSVLALFSGIGFDFVLFCSVMCCFALLCFVSFYIAYLVTIWLLILCACVCLELIWMGCLCLYMSSSHVAAGLNS